MCVFQPYKSELQNGAYRAGVGVMRLGWRQASVVWAMGSGNSRRPDHLSSPAWLTRCVILSLPSNDAADYNSQGGSEDVEANVDRVEDAAWDGQLDQLIEHADE